MIIVFEKQIRPKSKHSQLDNLGSDDIGETTIIAILVWAAPAV
jgi:hypothetical protein